MVERVQPNVSEAKNEKIEGIEGEDLMDAGIVSYGAYVPRYRITRIQSREGLRKLFFRLRGKRPSL